jgi:ketosteroid isomerase-like protein
MRKGTLLIMAIACIATIIVTGQNPKQNHDREQELRKLDLAEADAMLRSDVATVTALYADDIIGNSPRNTIVNGKQELVELIKAGNIHYASFVREVEAIRFQGDTAIVMGKETVKPDGHAPGAGQTILRRYTNIWMKRNSKWLLTARHANIICTN